MVVNLSRSAGLSLRQRILLLGIICQLVNRDAHQQAGTALRIRALQVHRSDGCHNAGGVEAKWLRSPGFGRFVALLGSGSPRNGPGSKHNPGLTENQFWKPIIRPVRGCRCDSEKHSQATVKRICRRLLGPNCGNYKRADRCYPTTRPTNCDFGDPKGPNEPKTKARHFGNAGPDHPPLIGRVIRAATSINVSMKWCR